MKRGGEALGNAERRCPSCGESRPAEHEYCFRCGARLRAATVANNTKGFSARGLGMGYGRIHLRQDRLGEAPRRTWGDLFARWFVTATVVGGAALWASSRGYLPAEWWEGVRATLTR